MRSAAVKDSQRGGPAVAVSNPGLALVGSVVHGGAMTAIGWTQWYRRPTRRSAGGKGVRTSGVSVGPETRRAAGDALEPLDKQPQEAEWQDDRLHQENDDQADDLFAGV